jgi:hypothetical protein
LVLYLVNRRTPTAPLSGRVLGVLIVLGLLAVGDAGAELTYLAIPKHETGPSLGCCTAAMDDPSHGAWQSPDAVLGVGDRPGLTAAYYAVSAVMLVGLYGAIAGVRRRRDIPALTPLLLGALVALPVSAAFLVEVAAPILLRLPYHHCPYDLLPAVPEAVLAAALFVGGTFGVGWAYVAARWGDCPESRLFLPGTVGAILRMSFFCYLYSIVLLATELALA